MMWCEARAPSPAALDFDQPIAGGSARASRANRFDDLLTRQDRLELPSLEEQREQTDRGGPPVGRHKTKREAVSAALAEYVKRRKQLRFLEAVGTTDFDPKYNYKIERRSRPS